MSMAASDPELDIVNPKNLEDPYPAYRALQSTDPVYWSAASNSWVLTRFNDVAAAYRDPRLSAARTDAFVKHQRKDPSIASDYVRLVSSMLLMLDGAKHTKLRKQMNPSFTAAAVEHWRVAIRTIGDGLLDAVQPNGQKHGKFGHVPNVSIPMPALVVMEAVGIPAADREKIQVWGQPVARFFAGAVGDVDECVRQANEGSLRLEEYLNSLVAERRKNPGHDLVSLMMAYEDEGKMEASELVPNLLLIFNAGHVTTSDQLSNGVYDLLTHPDQLARFKSDPSLLSTTIEETIRFTPATPFMSRIALQELEIGGKVIKPGQVVLLGMAAANRDTSAVPDADDFDVGRTPNKHLSFGAGPHLGIGASLGRLELEIALTRIFERMPDLRLDDQNPA